MPTLGENFGHPIIESLGSGLPVVISDKTPWRNLMEYSVGADISLSSLSEFVDYLEKLTLLDEAGFKQLRENCLLYTASWRKENLDSSRYVDLLDS